MTSQNIVITRLSERANPHYGSIADIAGLHIGHFTSGQRLTGCSVLLAPHFAGLPLRKQRRLRPLRPQPGPSAQRPRQSPRRSPLVLLRQRHRAKR